MILPGETIGVMGGGQLGRMFTVAARTMGYEVIVLDPDPDSPAGQLAHRHIQKTYRDPEGLEMMRTCCRAVTTEFENVPADSMAFLAEQVFVSPAPDAISIAQDRRKEKSFFDKHGIPTNRFAIVQSEDDLPAGLTHVGLPAVLKRAQLGYDGKGQYIVQDEQTAREAFRTMNHVPCVLEERLNFALEISVLLARGYDGAMVFYPPAENIHEKGILSLSIVPARISPQRAHEARMIGERIATQLNYCGVLAIEMFVMPDDRILVNELAPRPHNSGHYTLDACVTSQFQQQVRTLCKLPLGDTRLLTPAVMVNFLGEIWNPQPKWEKILHHPQVKLHLYGKKEPRPGRKMGHFTCVHENLDQAIQQAKTIKEALENFKHF